jgi:rod shape-determining protein MreB
VYARGRGIVLDEPSVLALDVNTNDVLAVGHEAWQMIGRTPGYIQAVRPLRQGAITDFDVTQRMIRLLLARAGVNRFNRPRVLICVPSAITEVERRAVTEAARRAGAADAQLIEQPVAAAIGAGLPINEPLGNMVVDIGGGTSETAVISLGGVVAPAGHPRRQLRPRRRPQAWVKREYGVAIGERTAETSSWPSARPARPPASDGPRCGAATSRAACEDGGPVGRGGAGGDRGAGQGHLRLGRVVPRPGPARPGPGPHPAGRPPRRRGGMLRGLDTRLQQETGLPVRLVEAPLECVVLGAGRCLESYDALKVMFVGARTRA